jgi:UDP-N-acetyl-2-amino-2-deoxyglucuronate dehydrogenase
LKLRWGRDESYYNDGWHGTWKFDGGVVAQQAIHHIFAVDSLIGPIKNVYALRSNKRHKIECEDTCNGIFELMDSTYITFELTTASSNGDFEAAISLLTENGVFEVNGRALNNLEYRKSFNSDVKKIITEEVTSGYGFGHVQEIRNFVKLVETKKNGFINIYDGKRAVKLVHAVYSSIEKNKWINLESNFESKKLGV